MDEESGLLTILGGLLGLAISAGFLGALSGLGGGVFIVPGLVIFANIPMHVAVGASLISVVATSAGASVAFVRDGWTNVWLAMILECATVTGALLGAYLAGMIPGRALEILFALMMLQSAYFAMTHRGDEIVDVERPAVRRACGSTERSRRLTPRRSTTGSSTCRSAGP